MQKKIICSGYNRKKAPDERPGAFFMHRPVQEKYDILAMYCPFAKPFLCTDQCKENMLRGGMGRTAGNSISSSHLFFRDKNPGIW